MVLYPKLHFEGALPSVEPSDGLSSGACDVNGGYQSLGMAGGVICSGNAEIPNSKAGCSPK